MTELRDPRLAAQSMAQVSYWLETCGEDLVARSRLAGDRVVDVAILGGGFSGLWTAYHLLRARPDLEVAIVEREVCGYGASGRNGGWCSPRFPLEPAALISRFGIDGARAILKSVEAAAAYVGEICEREGIDAHYRTTGVLSLARSPKQAASLSNTLATFARLGMDGPLRLLSAGEAFERVHATNIHAGLSTSIGAAVHPGRLARGLARVVERLGGTIYEGTAATKLRTGADAAIVTAAGDLSARLAVVAAGEAYLTGLPRFHRSLLPMSSMIVLTEPLSESLWSELGWQGGECLSSLAHTKNYLTRTADGRILYGSRGANYRFGSRMDDAAIRDETVFEWMCGCVREWWPALEGVRFTHAWGGYLGIPRDWMPTVTFDRQSRLAQLHGYTGRGVATSSLFGKLLGGLITDQCTGLEKLPFHRSEGKRWEPEPFRWLGVRYVQNAFSRIDEADAAGRAPPFDASIAAALGDP